MSGRAWWLDWLPAAERDRRDKHEDEIQITAGTLIWCWKAKDAEPERAAAQYHRWRRAFLHRWTDAEWARIVALMGDLDREYGTWDIPPPEVAGDEDGALDRGVHRGARGGPPPRGVRAAGAATGRGAET